VKASGAAPSPQRRGWCYQSFSGAVRRLRAIPPLVAKSSCQQSLTCPAGMTSIAFSVDRYDCGAHPATGGRPARPSTFGLGSDPWFRPSLRSCSSAGFRNPGSCIPQKPWRARAIGLRPWPVVCCREVHRGLAGPVEAVWPGRLCRERAQNCRVEGANDATRQAPTRDSTLSAGTV